MAKKYALINTETLKLIRESIRVSYEYIYKKSKIVEEEILAWEDNSSISLPSIVQAKNLAKCYHVPFAGLYMRPEDVYIRQLPKIKNMRTIFGQAVLDDSALNLAILDLLNIRDFVTDTRNLLNETISSFSTRLTDSSTHTLAKAIREHFNISIGTQLESKSSRQFYLYIRKQVEAKDIIVHCFTGVDVTCARGVSVFFDKLPIIGVNFYDRYPAKIFTIIHELVHLLKKSSTYCTDFYNTFSSNSEEVFCNAVAGELLVPEQYLKENQKILNNKDNISYEDIASLADKFSVSREVIVRRLLDLGTISRDNYNERMKRYQIELVQEKELQKTIHEENNLKGIPRNIPRETIDKNSENLFRALLIGYGDDLFDKQDIARYLGINQKHINNVLMEVAKI